MHFVVTIIKTEAYLNNLIYNTQSYIHLYLILNDRMASGDNNHAKITLQMYFNNGLIIKSHQHVM